MDFEVVIIGASTSGLYAAQLLAQAGKKVGVFEAKHKLEPARRTYIITPGLGRVLGDIPEPLVLHHINKMAVETECARTEIPLKDSDLILERNLLTKHLAQEAQEAGAELFMGHGFQGFETTESSPRLILEADGNTIAVQAGAVIGADGIFSQVAQAAGIPSPPVIPLLQAEIALHPEWNSTLTKVWFNVADTRYFYWLIPESRERAVVGLVGEPKGDIRTTLDDFLDKHGFVAGKYQAGWAAMHHPSLRPWGNVGGLDVLLIGDAAGQVKVTTVGGSVTGFWGAKAAVRSLLGDSSYQNELRPLKRELDIHWYIRALLERLDNPGYDHLVNCITPAVQRFLARYHRDEMAKNFWKLAFVQPRFFLLGLRLLLGSSNHEPLPRFRITQD